MVISALLKRQLALRTNRLILNLRVLESERIDRMAANEDQRQAASSARVMLLW